MPKGIIIVTDTFMRNKYADAFLKHIFPKGHTLEKSVTGTSKVTDESVYMHLPVKDEKNLPAYDCEIVITKGAPFIKRFEPVKA